MSLGVVAVIATILGVPLGVVGIIYVARQQARDQAKARDEAKQAVYNDGYKAGQAAAAPDLALMRSQRDDARRERDDNAKRIERLEGTIELRDARIDHLEDERAHRKGSE